MRDVCGAETCSAKDAMDLLEFDKATKGEKITFAQPVGRTCPFDKKEQKHNPLALNMTVLHVQSAIRCTAEVVEITADDVTINLAGEENWKCIPGYVGIPMALFSNVKVTKEEWGALKVAKQSDTNKCQKDANGKNTGCVINSFSSQDDKLQCQDPLDLCDAIDDEASCKANGVDSIIGQWTNPAYATRCVFNVDNKCSSQWTPCDMLVKKCPSYCAASTEQKCLLPNNFMCAVNATSTGDKDQCGYAKYNINKPSIVDPLPANATDICKYDAGTKAECEGNRQPPAASKVQ